LSGSLDQSVRVHRTSNYSVLHTYKYTAPILSLAISPDNARIVVGCSDGLLHIKQRVGETSDRPSELDKALLKAEGAYRYFTNTKNDTVKPQPEKKKKKKKKKEEQVDRSEVRVSRKVTAYDRLLADFQFAQALDSVLGNQATRTKEEILELRRRGVQEKMQKLKKSTDDLDVFLGDEDAQLVEEEEGGESTADPVEVISLLMELQRRHVLVKALSGRDPASLAFILRFLIKHLSCQSYTSFLLSVTSIVFDIYEPTIGQSPTSDKLFRILQKRVQREQQYLTALAKLQGSLELILG
jgi:U3 small nucleolar RNA-associated protein 15